MDNLNQEFIEFRNQYYLERNISNEVSQGLKFPSDAPYFKEIWYEFCCQKWDKQVAKYVVGKEDFIKPTKTK